MSEQTGMIDLRHAWCVENEKMAEMFHMQDSAAVRCSACTREVSYQEAESGASRDYHRFGSTYQFKGSDLLSSSEPTYNETLEGAVSVESDDIGAVSEVDD